jgi:CHAD domain-containing protein/transposase-like protein
MGTLISPADIGQIESLAEQGTTAAIRRRARLLLLYDQGLPTSEVAERVGLSPSRTRYWRRRFIFEGMQIFAGSTTKSTPAATEPLEVLEEQVEPAEEEANEIGEQLESRPISLDELRQRYPANLRRAEHRRDLALQLFDETQAIHQLPDEQRRLLEVAALLQYLTESQEDENSSKAGYLFILSHPLTDLSEPENKILEDVLRYQHDKVDLNAPAEDGASLLPEKKEALALASLLRIAHGLDASQSQETTIQAVEALPQEVSILVVGPNAKKDARRAKKSARLWSTLFDQKVRLQAVVKLEIDDKRLDVLLAKTSPGVRADDTLAEAGRKVLGYHFAQMVLHENGTRVGKDIEELHDMRVATRRMRSAFDVFSEAFERKEIKKHLKGLRATGRALGRVRDLDVFMEKARSYLETIPQEERNGLDPLLSIWQKEREIDREKMLAHLNGESYATFKRRFLDFLSNPNPGKKISSETTPHLVQHVVPVLVYERLAAVRAYSSILESATIEQLHGLRIEFKKLRYTLEFFREVLGESVKELIEEIKTMQDHLGDLNDADVACDILKRFLDDWESRQVYKPISERDNPEPIVAYLAAKHAERYFLTTTFNNAWQNFERPAMRSKMASAIAVL